MQQPPLLPEETLLRVHRVARIDGLSILIVASVFAVLAAVGGDVVGAIVGLLVAGAGALELHGAALLTQGETRGMNWLVNSQLFLLLAILVYCGLRLLHPDFTLLRASVTDEAKASLTALGWTVDEFLKVMNTITCLVFALVSCFYQGGMAIYYFRRRAAVAKALAHADI
jgi:hypothetical protein